MIPVNVTINGVIIYCDDSILGIELGNGYKLEKKYINELPFKNDITDGTGQLLIEYLGSQLEDENGEYLICVSKEETYDIELSKEESGKIIIDDSIFEKQIDGYKQKQMFYLHKVFSLLHLFKEGNIGFVKIVFVHNYSLMGFMKYKAKQSDTSVSKNYVDERRYTLNEAEKIKCNQFINKYDDSVYMMLKNSIDKFILGIEQVDLSIAFEQYTTALEMTILSKGQRNKKETLAKRVAVLLEKGSRRLKLYNTMKRFYKYRSESLHEGKGHNISKSTLVGLENVVRKVLVLYLDYCQQEIIDNPSTTWEEIKAKKIRGMITEVNKSIKTKELPN